jgi:hypothetical protein
MVNLGMATSDAAATSTLARMTESMRLEFSLDDRLSWKLVARLHTWTFSHVAGERKPLVQRVFPTS